MKRGEVFWKVWGVTFFLLVLKPDLILGSEVGFSEKNQKSDQVLKLVADFSERHVDVDISDEVPDEAPDQHLAIKTNLIYDVLLMPSLELEYRFKDRWSVNVEGEVAWWKNDAKHQYYQIATIIPEGRFWFKTRNPWHGHYVGVFVGGNWYDLEAGKRGVQGESVLAGVSYGYMWPVTRCLSFEAGLGIGYMYTKFEEYLPEDGCYVYQRTKKMHYFGPLKLKLGFVWRLWNTKKKEAQ